MNDILQPILMYETIAIVVILAALWIGYGLIPHLRKVTWTYSDYWWLSLFIEIACIFILVLFVEPIIFPSPSDTLVPDYTTPLELFGVGFATAVLLNIVVAFYGIKSGKWVL